MPRLIPHFGSAGHMVILRVRLYVLTTILVVVESHRIDLYQFHDATHRLAAVLVMVYGTHQLKEAEQRPYATYRYQLPLPGIFCVQRC